jgi:uncharacterized protein YecA (UPF0149 family)
MATPAQCIANAGNAQFSTGPKTEEGKEKAAKNAVRHGLFAACERLAPADTARIEHFFEDLHAGIPAQSAAREFVIRQFAIAMWRSEICCGMEASFLNSAVADEAANPESAALTGESGKNNLLGRALRRDSEGPKVLPKILRYLSLVMKELHSASDAYQELIYLIAHQKTKTKPTSIPKAEAPQPETAAPPESPESPVQTPRNAACPCGSGQKFKRCCGEGSPAVLCAA